MYHKLMQSSECSKNGLDDEVAPPPPPMEDDITKASGDDNSFSIERPSHVRSNFSWSRNVRSLVVRAALQNGHTMPRSNADTYEIFLYLLKQNGYKHSPPFSTFKIQFKLVKNLALDVFNLKKQLIKASEGAFDTKDGVVANSEAALVDAKLNILRRERLYGKSIYEIDVELESAYVSLGSLLDTELKGGCKVEGLNASLPKPKMKSLTDDKRRLALADSDSISLESEANEESKMDIKRKLKKAHVEVAHRRQSYSSLESDTEDDEPFNKSQNSVEHTMEGRHGKVHQSSRFESRDKAGSENEYKAVTTTTSKKRKWPKHGHFRQEFDSSHEDSDEESDDARHDRTMASKRKKKKMSTVRMDESNYHLRGEQRRQASEPRPIQSIARILEDYEYKKMDLRERFYEDVSDVLAEEISKKVLEKVQKPLQEITDHMQRLEHLMKQILEMKKDHPTFEFKKIVGRPSINFVKS